MELSAWDRLNRSPLYLDQTSMPLQIDRQEVERFYAPLALKLLERAQDSRCVLVVVAGPPGSGKTAFATLLAAVIQAVTGRNTAAMIQQDGWHYPNEYLDSHTILRGGESILLRQIKGAPETYDVASADAFLTAIHQDAPLDYPLYSRQAHDPIPGAGKLKPEQRIIILEGNYWLLDEAPWSAFRPLFDITIMLAAPRDALIEALRQRHLRGGKTAAFTQQHMASVDIPNIERVIQHSAPADVLIHKSDSQRIQHIEYRSPAVFIPPALRGLDQNA